MTYASLEQIANDGPVKGFSFIMMLIYPIIKNESIFGGRRGLIPCEMQNLNSLTKDQTHVLQWKSRVLNTEPLGKSPRTGQYLNITIQVGKRAVKQ